MMVHRTPLVSVFVIVSSLLFTKIEGTVDSGFDRSPLEAQFSADPYVNDDKLQLVLNRQLQLVGCNFQLDSFSPGGKVSCYYCDLGTNVWNAQKQDPSVLPSFRDMLGISTHCDSHAYSFDLEELVEETQKYDSENGLFNGQYKGVIYNQPSSGSSVLTNAIIVGDANSRVYADHPAIVDLVNVCNDGAMDASLCDFDLQVAAMKDLLYLLSRTAPGEDNIYLKMIPSSAANMNVLRAALEGQDTKWVYVWRDADEILTKATERKYNSCLKNRNNPSKGLLRFVQDQGHQDLKALTDEEVCSAYYAYNHETAVNELSNEDPNTLFLNYESSIKSLFQSFYMPLFNHKTINDETS